MQFEWRLLPAYGLLICGTVILAVWLVIRRGPGLLADAPPRPHRLSVGVPLVVLVAWILLNLGLVPAVETLFGGSEQRLFLRYVTMIVGYAVLCMAMVLVARRGFEGGLAGFGLRWRTIPRDLGWAVVSLLATWPLVYLAVVVVIQIGRLAQGEQFEFEQNPGLTDIQQSAQMAPYVPAVLLVFTLLVVPVFEELLFRGLFQSMIRGLVERPWPAILLTSVPFAVLHPQTHWPALLILGMCLGYVYERSGSLLRSIFVHMLFNAINVALTFLE